MNFVVVSLVKVLVSCVVIDNTARIMKKTSEIPGVVVAKWWFWFVNVIVAGILTLRMTVFSEFGFNMSDYFLLSLDNIVFVYLVMRDRYHDSIAHRTMGQKTKEM